MNPVLGLQWFWFKNNCAACRIAKRQSERTNNLKCVWEKLDRNWHLVPRF
jgi:hypothetical protein